MFLTLKNRYSPWLAVFRAPDGDAGASGASTVEATPPVTEAAPEGTVPPIGAEEGAPSFLTPDPKEGDGEGEAKETTTLEPLPPVTMEDFTLPEGIELPDEDASAFLEVLNSGLSPKELGQKLLDMQAGLASRTVEAVGKEWDTLQNQWKGEAKAALTALGTTPEEGNAQITKGLLAAGATKEAFQALHITGAANNPEIVKLFYALTKPFVEGGQVAGAAVRKPMSPGEKLANFYNHPTSQQKG